MSTPAGDDLIGNASIRVDANTDPATLALAGFSRDAQGRIRDVRGRFVAEGTLINRSLTTAAGGGDRFSLSLRGIASIAGSAGAVLGRVGLSLGAVGAAAGTAAPLLAGIVTTLQNVAPAGAVAVTGMLAVQQASAAIKLSMVGVEDAVTAAFDTSEAGAKKFDEALKKLAPNARAFALQVRELQPAFQKFQQGIQNRVFAGLDDELKKLSTTALPVVRKNLNQTATALNQMALGVTGAARQLATNGTLGQAMAGANQGLANLRRVPGQVVTALGQLATAGAPAFSRLTSAAGSFATSISERLSTAFQSGALENAVNTAVGLLKDLGTVASNVFGTIGNIMAPVQAAGGGLIGTLVQITGALKSATGTQAFQAAIASLAGVMGTLARTVGPLLGQALGSIAPVFIELGPPVQRLIEALGAGLSPIIVGLRPVLAAAADAVGILVDAVSPLLPVIGNLVASLLPPLVPLITSIGDVFAQLGPVVQLLGKALATALAPIIAQLPTIIAPLATHLTTMARTVFPMLAKTIVQLAPSLAQVGVALGQVLAAAGPLLTALSQLTVGLVSGLMPVITPLIGLVGKLAAIFAGHLSRVLTSVVVPAINALTSLLRGDFSKAWDSAKQIVSGAISTMNTLFQGLPGKLFNALSSLAGKLKARATEAGTALVSTISGKISEAVNWVRGLPGRAYSALAALAARLSGQARSAGSSMVSAIRAKINEAVSAVASLPSRAVGAVGNLGGRLYSAGRDLIQGMINGIRDMAGSIASQARSVVSNAISAAKSALGISSPSKVFAEIGRDTGRGLVVGLDNAQNRVNAAASRMAATVSGAFSGAGTGIDGRVSVGSSVRDMSALGVGAVRTATAAGAPATFNLTVNLTNTGIIASQREMDNWLTASLDRLRLQGRLPLGRAA